MPKLRTTCERELWAGFFGINENGDQPECSTEIEIEVEEEDIERDKQGIRPYFAVECPKCHGVLEWPHAWEIVE